MTKVVIDPYMGAYIKMVMTLNGFLDELVGWAERCPCHNHVQSRHHSKHVPVSVVREEFGSESSATRQLACCMRGRRAPELAAGALLFFV